MLGVTSRSLAPSSQSPKSVLLISLFPQPAHTYRCYVTPAETDLIQQIPHRQIFFAADNLGNLDMLQVHFSLSVFVCAQRVR